VSALPRQGLDGAVAFAAPAALVLLVALVGNTTEAGTREDVIAALVAVTIVVALHVFVGNSGVISFGHISFVALGAFAAGLMTIPTAIKPTLLPELFPFLAQHDMSNVPSLALAAALGAHRVCHLQGHGIVSVATTIQDATLGAIHLERLAEVNYRVAQLGREPRVIPPHELMALKRQLASPAGRWAYYAELASP